jgi:hypothetical protein
MLSGSMGLAFAPLPQKPIGAFNQEDVSCLFSKCIIKQTAG